MPKAGNGGSKQQSVSVPRKIRSAKYISRLVSSRTRACLAVKTPVVETGAAPHEEGTSEPRAASINERMYAITSDRKNTRREVVQTLPSFPGIGMRRGKRPSASKRAIVAGAKDKRAQP